MQVSEYLSKKAMLESIGEAYQTNLESPDQTDWDEGYRSALRFMKRTVLSGAFDADESEGTWKATSEFAFRLNDHLDAEVQRLRAALEEVHEELKTLHFMVDSDDNIFHEQKKKYLSIIDHVGQSVAGQVLSTTTEPKQDKACVICGKREGKYLSTANRWFCEPCTDALPPVNANAEKVERMREGDGNE